MRPTPLHLLPGFLLLLATTSSTAGELGGKVSLGYSAEEPQARVGDTVIWLEQIPENTERQLTRTPFRWTWRRAEPPPLAELAQSGRRYEPHVVALAKGSALVIHNEDDVWHGPFSVSHVRAFELGKRPPGSADTISFETTGVVAVRCDIHPDMSAFVVVTPNHAFTQPDSSGNWRLPELPAGHYVVHAWHPGLGETRHEVDVPAHGSVTLPLRW